MFIVGVVCERRESPSQTQRKRPWRHHPPPPRQNSRLPEKKPFLQRGSRKTFFCLSRASSAWGRLKVRRGTGSTWIFRSKSGSMGRVSSRLWVTSCCWESRVSVLVGGVVVDEQEQERRIFCRLGSSHNARRSRVPRQNPNLTQRIIIMFLLLLRSSSRMSRNAFLRLSSAYGKMRIRQGVVTALTRRSRLPLDQQVCHFEKVMSQNQLSFHCV